MHTPAGKNDPTSSGYTIDELAGDKEAIAWGEFPLMGEDVLYVGSSGGGGFGDPLDRDPETVLNDVRGALTSARDAEEIYGVVFNEAMTAVDKTATAARRDAIRNARVMSVAAE